MNTKQLAEKIGILSTTIHRRVCTTGSYFGLRPQTLVNGRLLWPEDAVEQLLAQRSQKTKEADHAAS